MRRYDDGNTRPFYSPVELEEDHAGQDEPCTCRPVEELRRLGVGQSCRAHRPKRRRSA